MGEVQRLGSLTMIIVTIIIGSSIIVIVVIISSIIVTIIKVWFAEQEELVPEPQQAYSGLPCSW